MHLGPVSFFLLQVSLGASVGTVRHGGGSSFAALSLSPAAQLLRPSLYLGAAASASLLEGGGWAGQGRADLWAALSPRRPLRLAANATAATTTRTDGLAAGVASVLGELVYAPDASGRGGIAFCAGPVAGALEGEPGIGSLRLRARGWAQPWNGPFQFSLTLESTRFLGAWYSDVIGSVSRDDARLSVAAWLSVRLSGVYGATGAASASLQYFFTPTVALELSGGSYLRDPFQALPQAGFASAGVRIHASPRAPPPPPARPAQLAPLVAQRRSGVGGDSVFVRFRMDARRSLAIAGDWNAWEPIPLQPLGDDIWEATLVLRPGTYHFNLFVDETEWVVPGGVAVVPDGMGGVVAVLTVL